MGQPERHTERMNDLHDDAHRGMTWREVWARQVPRHVTGWSRVTNGSAAKPAQPEATTPRERHAHPMERSR